MYASPSAENKQIHSAVICEVVHGHRHSGSFPSVEKVGIEASDAYWGSNYALVRLVRSSLQKGSVELLVHETETVLSVSGAEALAREHLCLELTPRHCGSFANRWAKNYALATYEAVPDTWRLPSKNCQWLIISFSNYG